MLNCERCGAEYQEYNDSDTSVSFWSSVGNEDNQTKGLCPFCNQHSQLFNEEWRIKNK